MAWMEKDYFNVGLNWWNKLTGPFCRLWWRFCEQWKDFGYCHQRFFRLFRNWFWDLWD